MGQKSILQCIAEPITQRRICSDGKKHRRIGSFVVLKINMKDIYMKKRDKT